jgi:hypothetical protein
MSAMFDLVGGGLGVMPDPDDNPDGHVVPHHDAGIKITFEVANVGDSGGNAKVGIELDDVFQAEWESGFLDPGAEEVGQMSLGRVSEGDHSVLVFVNPGSGAQDHDSNDFSVA